MPEIEGYQVFVTNKASLGGSVMFDCNGKRLWEFPCNGYCQTIHGDKDKSDMILHRPSPGRVSLELQKEYLEKAKRLEYENLPIEAGKPSEPILINGYGEIVYRFMKLEDINRSDTKGVMKSLPGDFGLVYNTIIDDIDNDGHKEWIAYKRHKVWIYKEY